MLDSEIIAMFRLVAMTMLMTDLFVDGVALSEFQINFHHV